MLCDSCRTDVKITYHVVVDGCFKNYCWHCKRKNEKEVVELKYTRHHVVPRSRVRKSKRTVLLPERFHDSWHNIFGNLKPIEAIYFLREINAMMYNRKTITARVISELQEKIKKGGAV